MSTQTPNGDSNRWLGFFSNINGIITFLALIVAVIGIAIAYRTIKQDEENFINDDSNQETIINLLATQNALSAEQVVILENYQTNRDIKPADIVRLTEIADFHKSINNYLIKLTGAVPVDSTNDNELMIISTPVIGEVEEDNVLNNNGENKEINYSVSGRKQVCPSGVGPGGITPGFYKVGELTSVQQQWLYNVFGHVGIAPDNFKGEECSPIKPVNHSDEQNQITPTSSPTPEITPTFLEVEEPESRSTIELPSNDNPTEDVQPEEPIPVVEPIIETEVPYP